MAEECNNECSGCPSSGNCSKEIKKLSMQPGCSAKKIIGIVSGKGGVGKSFVTAYLAVLLARKGKKVGILDGDITGPSIPFAYGMKDKALATESAILPRASKKEGIKIISSNMLLDNEEDPICWRGPMIGSLVQQFYTDVYWEELDYLLIDMPPGTSDVALTAFQSMRIDSLVLVATPQNLVKMIVEKAAKMASLMNIKIGAIVTNMSYVICPDCGKRIDIYGDSKINSLSEEYDIPVSVEVPFDSQLRKFVDEGNIENLDVNYLDSLAEFYLKD